MMELKRLQWPRHMLFFLSTQAFVFSTQASEVSIETLYVNSVITHRFATTHVTSALVNKADSPKEVTFDIRLPSQAFISNFSMLIDGTEYPGHVARKEEAKKLYDAAVQFGQSAGHVRASPRQSNKFAVSVNVAALMNVTFDLRYEEFLKRQLGIYEHVIYIDPGQTVQDLQVDVYIVESRIITDLSVPPISNDFLTDVVIEDTNEYARIEKISDTAAHISFAPTPEEQLSFSAQGVSGQFIVNYDVQHESEGIGEILVSQGYFVHFFAPTWLTPMGKRLMFVLDTSGSMSGTKIDQLKQAMITILDDLFEDDKFGIITFSSGVELWNGGELLDATYENIERAKDFARNLRATGGTNMNAGLQRGIQLLKDNAGVTDMLIFLTDGMPTSGVTNRERILENVREANYGISIFGLAFGTGADYNLMKKLSAQNNGLARKIFQDADADLQLVGFYDEISAPLLSDLRIRYIGDSIDNTSLTSTNLHCLFDGAEMVVAGRLIESSDNNTVPTIDLFIEGNLVDTTLVIDQQVNMTESAIQDIPTASAESMIEFTHRLWVYLTIKDLIDTTLQSTDTDTTKMARDRATELSLKYNFVTPFTSMVVVKPGEDEPIRETVGGRRRHDDERESNFGFPTFDLNARGLPGLHGLSGMGPSSGVAYRRPMLTGPQGFPGIAYSPGLGYQRPMSRPIPDVAYYKPMHTRTSPTTRRYTTTTPTVYGITRPTKVKLPRRKGKYPTSAKKNKKIKKMGKNKLSKNGKRNKQGYPPAVHVVLDVLRQRSVTRASICFDIPKTPSQPSPYELLQTDQIDLTATASASYTHGRKFSKIVYKTSNTTVTFTTRSVTFGTRRPSSWWEIKHMNITGADMETDSSVRLNHHNSVSVVVHKHGIKSRRSRAKPFLTVSVEGLTKAFSNARGILGGLLKFEMRLKDDKLKFDKKGPPGVTVYNYDLPGGSVCHRLSDSQSVNAFFKI